LKEKVVRIALIGNPNTGKTSLFNHLTGLNQKVGNFPGVTVDKVIGKCKLTKDTFAEIIDLPGTYSLYPKSLDEQVVFQSLSNPSSEDFPDLVILVLETVNLKRGLFLLTQVSDLGMPVVAVLNEMPVLQGHDIPEVDSELLAKEMGVPVYRINARTGKGIPALKEGLLSKPNPNKVIFGRPKILESIIPAIRIRFRLDNDFLAVQYIHQFEHLHFLSNEDKQLIRTLIKQHGLDLDEIKALETLHRYEVINERIGSFISDPPHKENTLTDKIDSIITHKVWGYLIFLLVLFITFQAIFSLASYPMDLIDQGMSHAIGWVKSWMPPGPFTNLVTEGLIAGIGGVVMFIPQIALLFMFVSLLEESGYMARVMFIMDAVMRKVGLNGRSVVPLMSGVACAVPAIMSARTIDNWLDRAITIFVTPLMSCSARIPVYAILIALVVPSKSVLGLFNLQGVVLMGLYLLGFLAAVASAWVLSKILNQKGKSVFVMELPDYRVPRWQNVGISIVEKVKTFVFEAGKIIVAISIILWFLASYGPGEYMENASSFVGALPEMQGASEEELGKAINAYQLEHSYAGTFGKFIEPAIAPLGFDWKIGVALITSFAAREVFVGTMGTIYSIGADDENTQSLKERMQAEINPETGESRYTVAVAFSLMVFYAFALQCMSTVAVVYREMKSWVWPLAQVVYMSSLAYLSSLLVYQLFK
jgi:ferrous iron transport protein B